MTCNSLQNHFSLLKWMIYDRCKMSSLKVQAKFLKPNSRLQIEYCAVNGVYYVFSLFFSEMAFGMKELVRDYEKSSAPLSDKSIPFQLVLFLYSRRKQKLSDLTKCFVISYNKSMFEQRRTTEKNLNLWRYYCKTFNSFH